MKNLIQYGAIILLVIAIYMLVKQGKLMAAQTSLLMAIAGKMGLIQVKEEENGSGNGNGSGNSSQQKRPLTEEEEDEIIIKEMTRISDLIKAKEALDKKDEAYYNKYFDEMHEDLQLAPPADIIKKAPAPPKVRLSADDKRKKLLEFFGDNKAKTIQELSKMLAAATSTEPNEGNTHTLLKPIVENEQLKTQKLKHAGKHKVFYALPDWMDKTKIKKEYLPA